ncbi:hypothetical protein AZH53_08880 [Methanomicrobiaceae archaeon CYW5]|nr:hypothetical protein [Methanovulcanius yangii]
MFRSIPSHDDGGRGCTDERAGQDDGTDGKNTAAPVVAPGENEQKGGQESEGEEVGEQEREEVKHELWKERDLSHREAEREEEKTDEEEGRGGRRVERDDAGGASATECGGPPGLPPYDEMSPTDVRLPPDAYQVSGTSMNKTFGRNLFLVMNVYTYVRHLYVRSYLFCAKFSPGPTPGLP